MKKLSPDDLEFIVRTLMQQAARDRVELYALRLLLMESKDLSPEDFDRARQIAERAYASLLQLVTEDPAEQPDVVLQFLKAFEGPVQ